MKSYLTVDGLEIDPNGRVTGKPEIISRWADLQHYFHIGDRTIRMEKPPARGSQFGFMGGSYQVARRTILGSRI